MRPPGRPLAAARTLGIIAALLVPAGLALPAAGAGPATLGVDAPPAAEAFRARYEALREAASRGEVPEEIRREAAGLHASLQHYLVDADAAVDELTVRIRTSRDGAQAEALRRLVEKVAERERVALAHLRRLGELLGSPPAAPEPPRAEEGGRGVRIDLDFRPEDLSRTEME